MRWRLLHIGLAVALGAAPLAQQTEPEPPADLTGRWIGSAKFQTEAAEPCRYEGGEDPPSLILELRSNGTGHLRLSLEPPAGTACAPLAFESDLSEGTLTPSTARFKDAQGREWNLALQAGVLRGLFSGADGSGELALRRGRRAGRRAAAPETPKAPSPSPSPVALTPASGSAGGSKGPGLKSGLVGIVGANIVGLGALLAASRATQDQSAGTSTLICSPRSCVIGAPGEPCDCTSTITTGQACGQTQAGVPIRGACLLPDFPCQSLLSCNNGVCEDRLGSCPF